jgi:hypothetical protein
MANATEGIHGMNAKILSIAAAAGLLIGTTALGYAQSPSRDNAPGQRMQNERTAPGQPGASEYAPGQQMQDRGTVGSPGASEYAPGQQPPASTGQGGRGGAKGSPNSNTGGGMSR